MDESTMFISYSVTDGFAQVRFPLILATTVTMTSEKRNKKPISNEGIQQTHFTYTDMWLYTEDLSVCTCQRLTLRLSEDCFISRPSPYRAVNTFHLGYKNQSIYVIYGAEVTVCSEINTKHVTQRGKCVS
jgi:hypothetical protein